MIIDKLIMDKSINETIDTFCPKELKGDFVSYLYLLLNDYDQNKLLAAYNGGYINKLCGRIILNQLKSNTSPFYTIYRSNGGKLHTHLIEYNVYSHDNYSEDPYVDREKWIIDKITEVRTHLMSRHYYHKDLFERYYFGLKTYQQIEKETGINFQSVRVSVMKTVGWLKIKMKEE